MHSSRRAQFSAPRGPSGRLGRLPRALRLPAATNGHLRRAPNAKNVAGIASRSNWRPDEGKYNGNLKQHFICPVSALIRTYDSRARDTFGACSWAAPVNYMITKPCGVFWNPIAARLTEFTAMSVNFWLAAFSSSRVCSSSFATSLKPRRQASESVEP